MLGTCSGMPLSSDAQRQVVDLYWHTSVFPFHRRQCLKRREFVSLVSDEEEEILCIIDIGELFTMLDCLTECFVKEKLNRLQSQLSSCSLIERI